MKTQRGSHPKSDSHVHLSISNEHILRFVSGTYVTFVSEPTALLCNTEQVKCLTTLQRVLWRKDLAGCDGSSALHKEFSCFHTGAIASRERRAEARRNAEDADHKKDAHGLMVLKQTSGELLSGDKAKLEVVPDESIYAVDNFG